LFLTEPFCGRGAANVEQVIGIFEELQLSGHGSMFQEGNHHFLKINTEQLLKDYATFGISFAEVKRALEKPSKVPEKFNHLFVGNLFN
jgi:hypothetical protein